ncbi:sulfite exporter TauE/SafE family protein [Bradyrhizobium sp. CCGUVB14]|uniref:sulfite exporter TauE/SafE family protein n=1 Tax=Bradyrhizobium sp. CCGUVB14 TaxID=2949628 RepID=UPI0020B3D258|nr:sulfite exporter TauE/SafE family protein [Bradyrhizobium sp. CCGUVB14]MCP3440791.1 sulfite exporter TauE/SafE family protein [Bradyrhizobium sp. CCGUVB14]
MSFYLWLAAGSAAGGFINGLAGFGTALFALGFWLQILPPTEAVSMIVIMSVVSGLQGVALVRNSIRENPLRLSRFVLPGLLGIPIGVKLLAIASPLAIKLTVAAFLIVYGGFILLRRELPRLPQPKPILDCAVGFVGGILGGAASLSGVMPTIWCTLQPWTKSEQRAVMQPFNVVILAIAAAVYAMSGYYSSRSVPLILIVLPITLISAQAGIWAFKRLSDDQFRKLLVCLMFVSGLIIVAKEVLLG